MAHRRPSGPGLIQAMSSPTVHTFQPSDSKGERSMARLVLPPAHAAVEQRPDALAGLGRAHPVVGRAGVLGLLGADEGQVLGPRDVLGVGTVQVTVGKRALVEAEQRAVV